MNKLYSLVFASLMFFNSSLFATDLMNSSDANVTFTVNTQNITVGENGMYLGGGVFGGAQAHAMSDDDATDIWENHSNLDMNPWAPPPNGMNF